MNPLKNNLHTVETVEAYKRMQEQLRIDGVIFDSMVLVAQRRQFPFTLPNNQTQNPRKHEEIKSLLARYQTVLGMEELFFDLIEEIYLQLEAHGMQALGQRFLDLTAVRVEDEFSILLSNEGVWSIEWSLNTPQPGGPGQNKHAIIISVYKNNWGEIIPWDVVQYLRSGILLYRQGANATALALMAIAVEATLRDMLATRNYTFVHNANRANIYAYGRGQIQVNGGSYTLTLVDPVPQPAANLAVTSGGNLPVEVQIRREVKSHKNRIDLSIKCPTYLLDHWAPDTVTQPANTTNIGGLGEALRVARGVEHLIDTVDLPLDVDDVLKLLRNNLIHFSSDAMDTALSKYASFSATGPFTLRDFINNNLMVFNFISDIPFFVNAQYVKLWKAGIHIP